MIVIIEVLKFSFSFFFLNRNPLLFMHNPFSYFILQECLIPFPPQKYNFTPSLKQTPYIDKINILNAYLTFSLLVLEKMYSAHSISCITKTETSALLFTFN